MRSELSGDIYIEGAAATDRTFEGAEDDFNTKMEAFVWSVDSDGKRFLPSAQEEFIRLADAEPNGERYLRMDRAIDESVRSNDGWDATVSKIVEQNQLVLGARYRAGMFLQDAPAALHQYMLKKAIFYCLDSAPDPDERWARLTDMVVSAEENILERFEEANRAGKLAEVAPVESQLAYIYFVSLLGSANGEKETKYVARGALDILSGKSAIESGSGHALAMSYHDMSRGYFTGGLPRVSRSSLVELGRVALEKIAKTKLTDDQTRDICRAVAMISKPELSQAAALALGQKKEVAVGEFVELAKSSETNFFAKNTALAMIVNIEMPPEIDSEKRKEAGVELGETIAKLAMEKSKPVADQIVGKYARIIAAISRVGEFLPFMEADSNESNIKGAILLKLLNQAARAMKALSESRQSDDALVARLSLVEEEVAIFSTVFASQRESGELTELEDFQNVQIEVCPGADIPAEEKTQMRQIFDTNWNQPKTARIYEAISPGFEEGLNDPNNRFYRVKYGEQIVAFQRFTPNPDGSLYAASNNVRLEARGSRIGEACQREILGKEARNHTVYASVWAKLQVFNHYLAKSGFVAYDIDLDFRGTGEPYFLVLRDDKANPAYQYQSLPPDKILGGEYQDRVEPHGEEIVRVSDLSALKPYFAQSMVMTAFFTERGQTYAAFEKRQNADSQPVI